MPRSDTCAKCDELEKKIENNDGEFRNEILKEKQLHLKQANKFHELKKMYSVRARTGKVDMLSFDYMQNLPLPHIPTGDVFYAR